MRARNSLALAVLVLIACVSFARAQTPTTAFELPAQPLAEALKALAGQSRINIVFDAQLVVGLRAPALRGQLTFEDALTHLLTGTGLKQVFISPATVVLEVAPREAARTTSFDVAAVSAPEAPPAATPSAPANAATAPSATVSLEEVIVTATRREEDINKVPISITALTQENINVLGIKDFTDIARFTPGVAIDPAGTNTIAIRGISASAGAATTGVYIDDTPIQMRALGFDPDQTLPKSFDLQRVEVLRGPQGTLFGAGSEGGTVRYILNPPSVTTTTTSARAEISHTENGGMNYEAGVAQGGPIIDNVLGFHATAWFRQDGGWIDRYDPYTGALVDPNTNRQGNLVLRAALLWQPMQNLTITPSLLYQNRHRHGIESYWEIYSDPASARYGTGEVTPHIQPDRYYLPTLKIQYDMGPVLLISNTAYYNRYNLTGYDGTLYVLGGISSELPGAPATPYYAPSNPYYPLLDSTGFHVPAVLNGYSQPAYVTNWQQNWTQEFRLQSNNPSSPLTWTAGVYLESDRNFSSEELRIQSLAEETLFDETLFGAGPLTAITSFGYPLFGAPFLPNGDDYYLKNWGHDKQVAVYGQASYALGPVSLIAGGRYSKTSFDFTSLTLSAYAGVTAFGHSGHASSSPFTPLLGIQYHIDPNNQVYATYSEGFRVGGTNAPIPPGPGCEPSEKLIGKTPPLEYQPDKVQSYEIGAKNSLFNHRVQLANSLYYIKWNGIQQSVYLVSCGLQYTDNVGYAVSKGADIQADFLITPHLTLNTTAGYNSAYFTQNAPGNVVAKGDAVVGFADALPTWETSLGLQYTQEFLGHSSFVRFDYEFRGTNNRLTPTRDPATTQYNPFAFQLPATHFTQLRAGMHFGDWEIDAFCDNLFDTHTIVSYEQVGIDSYNFNVYNPADLPPRPLMIDFGFQPRTVGITAIFSR